MNTLIYKLKNEKDNDIYIKRDDTFPFSFGGNKARKAELFFNDIEKKTIDTVITYGSSSSNHCRVVSNMCEARGLDCYIITIKESKDTNNSKLIRLGKPSIIECELSDVKKTIDNLILKLKREGKKPYFIPGGGHGNIGTQAYVNCFDEIVGFEKKNNMKFDYIFFASGTGTTHAGLVCGSILNKRDDLLIIGISIAREKKRGIEVIKNSVEEYLGESFSNKIYFLDDWITGGYGCYDKKILNVIKNVYVKEGIPLDATYTGKAYFGMTEYLKTTEVFSKNILFIHTGGGPLFFDILEELQ